ncbi:MAG: glutamine synthetase GlnII [Patescibacteria group bacterium]
MSKIMAEYIWLDGKKPTAKLRSKTKILEENVDGLADLPEWGFDGSSTEQAVGHFSDCLLRPVYYTRDPIRGGDNILVLCEVFNADGTVHESNKRAKLVNLAQKFSSEEALFGIEQEYTFFDGIKPLGWPDNGFPAPQGGYYCGVGADEVFGRPVVEEHLQACLDAGLKVAGINAEVMPSQWEFQIGPCNPLLVSDQIWIARWLLYRIAEKYNISATLYPKPVKGEWNGTGAHTNFSTKTMRAPGGIEAIKIACEKLKLRHKEHIAVYGAHNEERLTGRHETCAIDQFRYGVSERGASIRIPMGTANSGAGYLEDRRPASNMDPYEVCGILLETICS